MSVRSAIGSLLVLSTFAAAGCRDGGTEPVTRSYAIEVRGGDEQVGAVADSLADPFEIVIRNTRTNETVRNVAVTWRIVTGTGGRLNPSESQTDAYGVARSRLILGADTGSYRIETTFEGAVVPPATFTARAIRPPELGGLSTGSARVGDTITVSGTNFGASAGQVAVVFSGIRGEVVSATATQVRVVVPRCLPTRTVGVALLVGAVTSNSLTMTVQGDASATVDLQIGQVAIYDRQEQFGCLRFPGGQTGLRYLIVPVNAIDVPGRSLPVRVLGLAAQTLPILASEPFQVAGQEPFITFGSTAAAWEAGLRHSEAGITPDQIVVAERRIGILSTTPPAIGSRREFSVLNKERKFNSVTAEVKFVNDKVVLYQDVAAPSGGFSTSDFGTFGTLFADPIYPTITSAFGDPSDVDGNGRVIVLFTPEVNKLTEDFSSGYVAGFFYGLDLTTQANSNRAEIFYGVVPDPTGTFGGRLAASEVLRIIPPILAHEFQHMVHFNQRVLVRKGTQEVLWVNEALAHMAEDVVADVFASRSDNARAQEFRLSNLVRASRYLQLPRSFSPISTDPPGTLEERGAQWLFMKYLAGHYGGTQLLKAITQTTIPSVRNIEAATGKPWASLITAWSVALWADNAPDLVGAAIDPIYTFPNIDLRQEIIRVRGAWPLNPVTTGFSDFATQGTLRAGSPAYVLMRALETDPKPLSVSVTGPRGEPIPDSASPRVALLRVR